MSKSSGNKHDSGKAARDHHANQKNPNNKAYKAARDHHANQKNPNNKAYRGGKK